MAASFAGKGGSRVDIYQRLKADHDKQRELAAGILAAAKRVRVRRRLFEAFCDEIAAHAAAEEQTLDAELLALSHDHELARQSVAEHDDLAASIDALAGLELSGAEWLTEFKNLKDRIDHHLEEEEGVKFALGRSLIERRRALKLGDRFEKLKSRELATWGKAPLVQRSVPGVNERAKHSPARQLDCLRLASGPSKQAKTDVGRARQRSGAAGWAEVD